MPNWVYLLWLVLAMVLVLGLRQWIARSNRQRLRQTIEQACAEREKEMAAYRVKHGLPPEESR